MENRKSYTGKYRLMMALWRALAVVTLTAVIKLLMGIHILAVFDPDSGNAFGGFPLWATSLLYALGTLFIFNSYVRVFVTYDGIAREEFLGKRKKVLPFFRELHSIIRTPELLTDVAVICVFVLIGTPLGLFSELAYIFTETPGELLLLLFPVLFLIPVLILIDILARYELRRYWSYLYRSHSLDVLKSPFRKAFKLLLPTLLYPTVFPYAFALLMLLVVPAAILGAFVEVFSVIGAILAVALIFLIIYGSVILSSLIKRHKFIKRLRTLCEDGRYSLLELRRPYASLFKPLHEYNILLEREGRRFYCRLIGSYLHRAPLFFTSKRDAFFLHKIGTKKHYISLSGHFEYDFPTEGEGDAEKIIILNPVPRRAYATLDNYTDYLEYTTLDDSDTIASRLRSDKKISETAKKLEPTDKIWGYGIYNATSFLGAVDRACLGRYRGMFD